MADVVKLVFGSAYQGAGVSQFVAGAGEATKAALRTTGAARNLTSAMAAAGSAAGGAVGDIARFVRAFAHMGAIGGVIAGVQILIDRIGDHLKQAADKMHEAIEKSASSIKTAIDSINNAFSSGASAVDKYTSRLEKQIDTTKRLAIAEKELEKQRALAANDSIGVAKADEDIAVIAAKSEEAKEAARVKGYEQRRKLASDAMRKAEKEYDKAVAEAAKISARRDAMLGDPGRRGDRRVSFKPGDESSAWGRANREAVGWANLHNGQRLAMLAANRGGEWEAMVKDYRDRTFREERKKLFASDEWKKSSKDLATATEAVNKASATHLEMQQRLADIDADEKRRLDENAAKRLESAAKSISDERDAAKAAAAERDRLDRELHQKRMADLRAEIAAQKEAASPLRAAVAGAKSQFEQAFDLWRDPEAAKAAQDEEKKRENDMKRFRKDVNRYGGKWRIDEYAELMRSGDEEGMQSKLAEWRKSSRFTPQVEQMVKAAAAEQNENAAERALLNIEKNTADLAAKIDQLLQVK